MMRNGAGMVNIVATQLMKRRKLAWPNSTELTEMSDHASLPQFSLQNQTFLHLVPDPNYPSAFVYRQPTPTNHFTRRHVTVSHIFQPGQI